jgi:hypothetical protein
MSEFTALMSEVMADAPRFGHRQHVHLTWLAVRRHSVAEASELIAGGIRQAASDAGAPEKYHATMTRAWVELVRFHTAEHPDPDFSAFLARNPALLDKRLLGRFYRPDTLAGEAARQRWVEPDLVPFPWNA